VALHTLAGRPACLGKAKMWAGDCLGWWIQIDMEGREREREREAAGFC